MAENLGLEFLEEFLGIGALQGEIELPGQAAQIFGPFHQVGVKPLLGQAQGGAHPGHAAPQDQGPGNHRKALGLQGGKDPGPAHRHGEQMPGLVQGRGRLLLVHPGALLPDVGQGEVAGIQARGGHHLPENRFMGAGAAGRHHHPVQPEVPNGGGHPAGGFHRTGKEGLFHVDHPGQQPGRGGQLRQVHGFGDVGAAVAEKDADPEGLTLAGRRPAAWAGAPGSAG